MSKVVALGEGIVAALVGLVIAMQDENNALGAGNPIEAEIHREGVTGTAGIYGADRAAFRYGDDALAFVTEGDGTLVVFDSESMVFAAFDNNSYIVLVNGELVQEGAGAGKFVISDNSGFVRITFGTAPENRQEIEVYQVVPVEVLNADAAPIKKEQVRAYEFMWLTTTGGTVDATSAYITHIVS